MKTLIASAVLLTTLFLQARILEVPSANLPTIQAGIDSSAHGDTVLVAPGVYFETINFSGKNIVVASHFILDSDSSKILLTAIDADSMGSVVTFESGEDSTAVLNGIRLFRGKARFGGGIHCVNSSPRLLNLYVQLNNFGYPVFSGERGGGIYLDSSDVYLENVQVSDNTAGRNTGIFGGGLYASNSRVRMVDCRIIRNKGESVVGGTGVAVIGGEIEMVGCRVADHNTFSYASHGGGLYVENARVIIRDCIIENNIASHDGGSVYLNDLLQFEISSTSITNSIGEDGGGISIINSEGTMSDVTVSGNRGQYGAGIYLKDAIVSIDASAIFGNDADFGSNVNQGGGLFTDNSTCRIANSEIRNNDAYEGGAGFFSNSTITLQRNLIYSNRVGPTSTTAPQYTAGAAFIFQNSTGYLSNLTITANETRPILAGRNCLGIRPNSSMVAVNCVFWANQPGEIAGTADRAIIEYSNIAGSWSGVGNISANPMFADSANGDFSLLPGSPLIDAGVALYIYNSDTLINLPDTAYSGSAPDMGAFEYEPPIAISPASGALPARFQLQPNYPNPFNSTTIIPVDLPKTADLEIVFYNLLGQEVQRMFLPQQSAGRQQIRWNAAGLNSGIYFYWVKAGEFTGRGKCLLVN